MVLRLQQAPIAIRPRFLGKLTTALQVIYIGWHLAWLAFGVTVFAPTDAYAVLQPLSRSGTPVTIDYAGVWLKAMRMARVPRRA